MTDMQRANNNATTTGHLAQLFETQAARTPHATAIRFEAQTLSYDELNARANRVAHLLRAAGAGPEHLVAVALPRSIELAVALLGILKAGAAYLPLDPEYPAERLAYMLADAAPLCVIGNTSTAPRLPQTASFIDLDDPVVSAALSAAPEHNPDDCGLALSNLAYVIYTSGSTGKPKGVMVSHAGIANLAAAQIERFAIGADSRVLQFASVSFDAAVSELCIALLAGATLVLAPAPRLMPGEALADLITQHGVTHATLPPSALAVMAPDALPPGFTLTVAGEACPPHLVEQWSPGRRMINAYGPTETTVCATMTHALQGHSRKAPPLGEPIRNFSVYLLDDGLEPVPPGTPGELYIAGIGLARGYRGQPGLTAERFVPDPHHMSGARMYRSGDLACRHADGTLEFLGRIDHQVKIRGFRIELGEIEAALAAHAAVAQAAVIAREDGAGQPQLVAYVVLEPDHAVDTTALRTHVATQLPDYMVPAAVVPLAALPLTPNGKLDRQALPAPVFSAPGKPRPRSEGEATLVGMFADVLGMEQFTLDDSFFDLGGHSLTATRLLSRIRSAFGVKLDLDDLFDMPSVAALAARLGLLPAVSAAVAQPVIARLPSEQRAKPLALSYSQQRLWFLDQLEPGNAFYNMPLELALSGPLDHAALERSLNDVLRRHDALRTHFTVVDDLPLQVVAPQMTIALPLTDLSAFAPDERQAQAAQLAAAEKRRPFDLSSAPLLRARLLRLAEDEHILVAAVHHTVADGWSMSILVDELAAFYRANTQGLSASFGELAIQYPDYAHWQRTEIDGAPLQAQLDYWKTQLAGAPALVGLPTDRPRPALRHSRDSAHLTTLIPASALVPLQRLAAQADSTLFAALLTVLDVLLWRWSGQNDLVLGTVVAGRTEEVLEPMIGCFVNFLPLRVQCAGRDTASALLQRVGAVVREAHAHQDAPFEKITEAVNPRRNPGHNPIFNVGLLLQNFPEPVQWSAGLSAHMLPAHQDTASLDLRFVAQESAAGLHLACEYDTALFEPGTVAALLDAFSAALDYCAAHPAAPLDRFELPATLSVRTATTHAKQTLAIAAGFTAEPLEAPLTYWMEHFDIASSVGFAPYNQVLQTLLDPHSLFGLNRDGANLVLLRGEDWLRYAEQGSDVTQAHKLLERNGAELIEAVQAFAARSAVPLVLLFCPSSGALHSQAELHRIVAALEQDWCAQLRTIPGVYAFGADDLGRQYPVANYEDVHGDELGHIPYNEEMYAALGSFLARKIVALNSRPYKVVVLDCDNTLWTGVCGEAGPLGVQVTPARAALQAFMLKQFEAGMLLCLASKNSPADVEAVFKDNSGMLLGEQHIVASRINWAPKSQNLRELAAELQLGLDSFIFIDDNPVECAEVEANCPGVLVLQVPEQESDIAPFLDHVWAFDRMVVTADAEQRTRQYRENRERDALRTSASSFTDFLASLQLQVAITSPEPAQLERAAELTQRTNQFNLHPQPRNAVEVKLLGERCLVLQVGDRFGDYGLTGVAVYDLRADALVVDTLLLSCRILGRGVEYRLMAHLGALAQQAGCTRVVLPFVETAKNQPILQFLSAVADRTGDAYHIDAGKAAELKPKQVAPDRVPSAAQKEASEDQASKSILPGALVRRIAEQLNSAQAISAAVTETLMASGAPAAQEASYREPATRSERKLAELWRTVLKRERIGIDDDFFALGGHSLLATQLTSKIRSAFHIDLPVRAVFEAPTIAALAALVDASLQHDQSAADLIPALPREENAAQFNFPASFAQQRLWFLDQFEGGSALYNIPVALRLTGALDVTALKRAFNAIVQRHEVLRTTFTMQGETLHQVVAARLDIDMDLTDLSALPHAEREAKAQWLTQDEAQRAFDLARGPLLRTGLLRLQEHEHLLLFTMHHIVSDGWSIGIQIRELAYFYGAMIDGGNPEAPALAALPIQYADFSQWQRSWLADGALQQQLAYWNAKLAGAPALLTLPTDRPRPAARSYCGATCAFTIAPQRVAALTSVCKKNQATLFMALAAAFNILLARHSGQDDICIGTPIANRNRSETEPLIGFFVNTLVLRAHINLHESFADLLQQVRVSALDAYAHQDVPFEQLVDALNLPRNLSHAPLFQVMLALQNVDTGEFALPGLMLARADAENRLAKFDLSLTFVEQAGALQGTLEYNTDLFDGATVSRMVSHFRNLLDAVCADPAAPIGTLAMLGSDELQRITAQWNDTAVAYPRSLSLQGQFEEIVARTPEQPALVYGNTQLSYAELNARANRLAHYLLSQGAGPDSLVGIGVERSLDMVVGLLGILKAGAAYVPLDPAYPRERLAYMLADAKPAVLLTQAHLADIFQVEPGPVVFHLDRQRDELAAYPAHNPGIPVQSGNLAYVIYTSGSTGRPKGVGIDQAGIVNRLQWMQQEYRLTPADRVLQKTPFSFDVSVWEFFWPLTYGATLVVATPGGHQDTEYLADTIAAQQITTMHFVPPMLELFLNSADAARCASLRQVICSGQALPLELQQRFLATLPECALHNLYGPTEASVDVTYWECRAGTGLASVPIGRPIANIQIYLLDPWGNPVPQGVAGELHIAGIGLARGYLGRPELTAEKFIPNPFSSEAGARMYKSGDLARHLPDGSIDYLGRIDDQVKIRGFRIELGEIEATLAALPAVREAVVMARKVGAGEARLAAYLVPETMQDEAKHALAPAELRQALLQTLPDYMVPAYFVVLDHMPLTPNGKVDRKALPAPETTRSERDYAAPRTPAEQLLAGIWADVLHLDKVGIHDNFFELGGDSMRSIVIVARAKEAGLALKLEHIFKHQEVASIVAALAAHLAEHPAAHPATPAVTAATSLLSERDRLLLPPDLEDAYPMSRLQAGMVYHNELTPELGTYHDIFGVTLRVPRWDAAAFAVVLHAMTHKHAILRTSFDLTRYSEPLQLVQREVQIPLAVHDLTAVDRTEQERLIASWFEDEKSRPFDLEHAPMMRIAIHLKEEGLLHCGFSFHHAILDGWSVASFQTELFSEYAALCAAGGTMAPPIAPPQLTPLRSNFRAAIAAEQRMLQSHEAVAFWDRYLAGCECNTLPPLQEDDGAAVRHVVEVALPASLHDALTTLSSRLHVSLRTLLFAAHLRVMSLIGGSDEVVTGLVSHARLEEEDGERVLGLFLNTLPFRQTLGAGSWTDLIRATFETELQIMPFRTYPYAQLFLDHGRRPLYETAFNYINFHVYDALQGQHGLEVLERSFFEATNFALCLHATNFGGELRLGLAFDRRTLSLTQVRGIAGYYAAALQAMTAAPDVSHRSVDYLPERERELVLRAWNATATAYPKQATIASLFAEQVQRTPHAAALIFDGGQWSYAELDQRAERLAQRLRSAGIGPDTMVGLCSERGPATIAALLAIVKAGAAYLPLDPTLPQARLRYLLDDAQPAMVLLQQQFLTLLQKTKSDLACLCIDDVFHDAEDLAVSGDGVAISHAADTVRPANLAYAIYTSGSTGQPKGVVVSQQNVVRLVRDTNYFQIEPGQRMLQLAPLSFDASTFEIWGSLLNGASLVIAAAGNVSVEQIGETIARQHVHTLWLTAALFNQMVEHALPQLLTARHVLAGGEALSPAHVQRFLAGAEQAAREFATAASRLTNGYGPTECTTFSCCHALGEDEGRAGVKANQVIPIGRPIANAQTYILDGHLNPVPPGVVGELYIGGDGLARGYLGRPGMTAEKFVPDPYGSMPGGRLYRSGDLARYLPDGRIDYVGRIDGQVKLRGFRIELGEIEAALYALGQLEHAVVLAREDNPGDRRLVAYLVPQAGLTVPEAEVLRRQLQHTLPDYMVPAHFVVLDTLPLTLNGKLDRRALPVPAQRRGGSDYVAPRNATEETLARIWADVLKLDRVGIHDNFFALGGHSLMATQAMSRARQEFGITLPLQTLFETLTVADLAQRYDDVTGLLAPQTDEGGDGVEEFEF